MSLLPTIFITADIRYYQQSALLPSHFNTVQYITLFDIVQRIKSLIFSFSSACQKGTGGGRARDGAGVLGVEGMFGIQGPLRHTDTS